MRFPMGGKGANAAGSRHERETRMTQAEPLHCRISLLFVGKDVRKSLEIDVFLSLEIDSSLGSYFWRSLMPNLLSL